MKHAQRMVLVPEADYKKHKKTQQKHKKKSRKTCNSIKPCKKTQGIKHKLAFLNAPARKLYAQHRAAKKAAQHVARMTLAPTENDSKVSNWSTPPAIETADAAQAAAAPAILTSIPLQHRARAKKILDVLLKRGYRYNSATKHLQLPTGRVLPNTNIVSILWAASVRDYRGKRTKPPGWIQFIDSIIKYQVPQSVFTKAGVKADLEERAKYLSSESDVVSAKWEAYE